MPPPPPPPPPPGGGGKTYAEKKAEEAAKLLDEYAAPADFAKAPDHALTEDEKYVIENKGTERAKTGKYDKFYPKAGHFVCGGSQARAARRAVACERRLFTPRCREQVRRAALLRCGKVRQRVRLACLRPDRQRQRARGTPGNHPQPALRSAGCGSP